MPSAPARRILIVDDEEKICRVLAEYFSLKGYQVTTALSGEAALNRCQTARPDIVLLDLLMPGLSGMDVLQRLKARDETLPVIIVSAADRQEAEQRALQLGANAYLSKPVDFSVLGTAVEHILRAK